MTRILFWLALAFLVLMAIRSKLKGLQQQQQQQRRQQAAPRSGGGNGQQQQASGRTQQLPDSEVMLCCAHCGVYYPASETVQAKGHDYCSHAHATV